MNPQQHRKTRLLELLNVLLMLSELGRVVVYVLIAGVHGRVVRAHGRVKAERNRIETL